MKTIEEAAKEIVDKELNYDRYNGITGMCMDISKKSIEFAQRWIPVEEEKPIIGEYILAKDEITQSYDAFRFNEYNERMLIKSFTHWRPIELK